MRFYRVLPIVSLLFGARAFSLDSRIPVAHPLDTRDTVDTCALMYQDAVVPDEDGDESSVGFINTCACLSTLPEFLETYDIATRVVSAAGEEFALEYFTGLIEMAPEICTYPDNSVASCSKNNACDFECVNGFTYDPPDSPTPTACSCPAGNMVCNGQCVPAGACASSQVAPSKRRWVGSGSCTERGAGWAPCGVFGGGARAWECVHTARDLESCGGCMLPLTPFSPVGKDCTTLPGIADVSCLSGECVVHRCLPGYALSRDGMHCTSTQTHISQPHDSVHEDGNELLEAIRYGLEHRPF